MGKIGDYVHYHAANYVKYGINRSLEGNETSNVVKDASEAARMQKQKLMASMNTINKDLDYTELQTKLSRLLRPPYDNGRNYTDGTSPEQYNELFKLLSQYFNDEFKYASERIVREFGNIMAIDVNTSTISKSTDNSTIKGSTIKSRMVAIQNAIDNVKKILKSSPDNFYAQQSLTVLDSLMEEINTAVSHLDADVQAKLKAVNITGYKTTKDNRTIVTATNDFKITRDLVTNSLIDTINQLALIGEGFSSLQRGRFFEYLIITSLLVGKEITFDKLKEAIESSWLGTSKTSVQINFSKEFIDGINAGNIYKHGYEQTIKNNNCIVSSILPSENKVDCIVTLSNNQTLKVSAKNVSLIGPSASHVTLVSGTSLLTLLIDLQNHDFVNHYLNQHAIHETDSLQINMFSDTQEILKMSILERALRGYKSVKGSRVARADTMIINDNQTGNIRIINMRQMLSQLFIISNLNNYVSILPDPSLLFFANSSASSWAERIANLLVDVHSKKITVAISPKYFINGV